MLEDFWIAEGTRKNPKNNASVYTHNLKLLKSAINYKRFKKR